MLINVNDVTAGPRKAVARGSVSSSHPVSPRGVELSGLHEQAARAAGSL